MRTAVFELLVANLADADCLCTTSPNKGVSDKLVNGAIVNLERKCPRLLLSMTTLVEVWRHQDGFYLSDDFVYGVAAAADNSVFLLGSQDYFGTSDSDFAAIKLDADGDYLWDWTDGSEGDDALHSAAAVVDGVVGCGYVNGTWNGELSLGGADFAVVKLYSNRTVAWRWKGGTDEDDFLYAAVEAVDGNVVVAGYTSGSWNVINGIWRDVAVAKLNVDDGDVIWRYQGGTTEDGGAYGRAAAVRGDGSIVVGGYTYGSFGTDFVGESGATDFIAVALDEDGNELWRWQDGPGTGFNSIYGVAAFDDDSILLAGKTEGSWAIDNVGEADFALAKLNASGSLEWSWQEGTEFEEEFASAAIGINGSVVLSGYTYGSWAATQVGTENDRDFVAMSINAERDVLWTYQDGSTSSDDFNDVAVRADGSIILGGWTNGIWTTSGTNSYSDFAAVLFNTTTSTTTSATLSTPSPIFSSTSPSIHLTTPSPTLFLTSSPIPSPTPSPTYFQESPSPLQSPPPTAISTETKPSSGSASGDPVTIIWSSIGGVAVVALMVICCFCWWRRDKRPEALPSPVPSTLPAPQSPIVETERPKTTGEANGVVNANVQASMNHPPAYVDSPPAYVDSPPAYTDPPPAYSSVA